MSAYKSINSEGEKRHSEGCFATSVLTPCTELMTIFSLNYRCLSALSVTAWLRVGRDTQGGRGA